MKNSKVSENITLVHALNCIEEQLPFYVNEPWCLAADMRDLDTMKRLAFSDYFKKIKFFRKKNLDSQKAMKGLDGNLKQMANSVVRSNAQFSYSVHSLATKRRNNRPVRNRILTELKLKYLESKNIAQTDWQNWFNPDEGVLAIKDKQGNYEVKISVDLVPGKSYMTWKIMNVLMKGQHHQPLFNFFIDFLNELSKNKQNPEDWQPLFIISIRKILSHIACVMIFLNAKQKIGKPNNEQSFSSKFLSEGALVNFSWHFDIFERLDEPNIRLRINDEQVLCIKCRGKIYTAKILLGEAGRKIDLKTMEQMFLDSTDMLIGLPERIYAFRQTLKKSVDIFEALKCPEVKIFAYFLSVKWLPENFNILDLQNMPIIDEGIYAYAAIEKGILIRIEQDLNISCWQLERGLVGCLLKKKNIKLTDLIEHMLLRKRINQLNKDLEFKIYQMYLKESQSLGMHFVYQFKAYRFAESNRIFKLSKVEEDLLSLSSDSNDNFVLIIRVSVNFQKIYFSAYKMIDGPLRQSEITDQFLSQAWRDQRQIVLQSTPPRYNYKNISECIFYICKYYMVERTFHKRMTEDQKKWTVYHFT